jgi:hypothetical protein
VYGFPAGAAARPREFAFFPQVLEEYTVFYNIIYILNKYIYIYIYINIYTNEQKYIYMYMCTRANTLHMGVEY